MQHLFIVPGNSLPSIPQEQDFLACSNTCTHPSAMTSTGWSEPVQSASITLATSRGLFMELSYSAYKAQE